MACLYCGKVGKHDFRCPNYEPPRPKCYCSECGDGILVGEQYVKLTGNIYTHYECLTTRQLLEELQIDVQTMEE